MSMCLNPCSIIVWPWPSLIPPVSSLKVLIRQCSITETLESQVAGMCTIDLFHCGFQQWLCAPQHRAPQEEPREHAETQSRRCPQSVMSAVTICCSAAGLVLTVFCSHMEGVFSEHTRCILNTLTGETWCVCPQRYSQVFCFILTLLQSMFVSYLSQIAWWQIATQSRVGVTSEETLLNIAVSAPHCSSKHPLTAWPEVKFRRTASTFEQKKNRFYFFITLFMF